MTHYRLETFPLESKDNDPHQPGVNMPINSKIVEVASDSDGQASILALVPADMPRVWHPLAVIALGMVVEVPIGVVLGDPLGYFTYSNTLCAVFPLLPWPTSSLLTAVPAGEG